MKLSLPLDVKIAKEGYLRLFAYWTIMTLLFFTALWCLLYEVSVFTTSHSRLNFHRIKRVQLLWQVRQGKFNAMN